MHLCRAQKLNQDEILTRQLPFDRRLPQNLLVMARQSGIIRIKGNLGGLSFYEKDGASFVKEKGGIEKTRILHDPAFKRTRENMAEFGGSATVGKALRLGLLSVQKLHGGRNLVGKITQRMKQINAKGNGSRGKRPFEIVANKHSLLGLEFNKHSFDSLFLAPYLLEANAQKNQVTVRIPTFNTSDYIHAPSGATHFRFVCAITVLSDYLYDDELGHYEPMNPNVNKLNSNAETAEIKLGGNTADEINLQCNLPGNPTLDDSSALIVCVGIEFLQGIGADFYSLKSDNALKIREVF